MVKKTKSPQDSTSKVKRSSGALKAATKSSLKDISENDLYSQSIYNQSSDGFVVIDKQKGICHLNHSAEKLIGMSLSKVKKTDFSRYLGRTSRKTFTRAFEDVKSGKSVSVLDLNMIDYKKNLKPVEVLISRLHGPNKEKVRIYLNVRDVSERKKKFKDVRELEKMQVLHHYMSGVSQEIHHPLKVLLNQAQRLIKEYSKRPFEYISFREFQGIMRSLGKMKDQIKYCHKTTERMMSLNKKRIGKGNACVQVNPLIEQKIQAIKHQFEIIDVSFLFRKGRDLKMAAISEQDLDLIIQSILTNSFQSMSAGGKIQLKTLMDKEGENVIIECKDTGVGIANDSMSRVFEPFFTTKHRGLEKNSGLGLSIVYSIVKSHRGEISIKSTLRKGTVVTVSFPVYKNSRKKVTK